jgi:hypothetical protein
MCVSLSLTPLPHLSLAGSFIVDYTKFGNDPCPGIQKFLAVRAWCSVQPGTPLTALTDASSSSSSSSSKPTAAAAAAVVVPPPKSSPAIIPDQLSDPNLSWFRTINEAHPSDHTAAATTPPPVQSVAPAAAIRAPTRAMLASGDALITAHRPAVHCAEFRFFLLLLLFSFLPVTFFKANTFHRS